MSKRSGDSGSKGSRGDRPAPASGSGRLRIHGTQPTVAPIQFQSAAGATGPQTPQELAPRRRVNVTLMAAGVLLAIAASIVAIRMVQLQKTDRVPAADELGQYAMACMACSARFEMPISDYRSSLQTRANLSVNRIRCPRCGAESAAYRTESGMPGLGELGPDGLPIQSPRRPAGQP